MQATPHDGQSCRTHTLYRMDCAEFDALNLRAAGHCEACGIPREDAPHRKLFIDHDHKYGMSAVRGLLCSHCNTVLGVLEKKQNSYLQIQHHPRFGPYMLNAWHMQLVHWARAQDGLLGCPDADLQSFNEAVLRFPTVARLTKLISQQPAVTSRGIIHPGYTGLTISAAYTLGRAQCTVFLHRSVGVALSLDGIGVYDHGSMCTATRYTSLTDARPHVQRLIPVA